MTDPSRSQWLQTGITTHYLMMCEHQYFVIILYVVCTLSLMMRLFSGTFLISFSKQFLSHNTYLNNPVTLGGKASLVLNTCTKRIS